MAVALSHQGSFGFALQAERGVWETPDNWLPLMEAGSGGTADTVALRKNYVPLDLADMRAYQSQYFSAGEWVEGQVCFPLVPGTLTDLLAWIQQRDGDNQGRWASAVIDCVHEVKQILDLKVRRATLDFVVGEPVLCTLEVVGPGLASGSAPTPAMPAAPPYLFREATVQLRQGGSLQADANCERIRVVLDTGLQKPEEGLRLTPAAGPQELYNLSGVRAWGALSRDFVDNAVYLDFATGTEAALTVSLQRGTVTAAVSLPRTVWTADHLGLPGSHEQRIVEKVEFLALGSLNGATPPVVLV